MKFNLTVTMDNAAFSGESDESTGRTACGYELARILRKLADSIQDGVERGDGGNVRDVNGNTVGAWGVTGRRV